MANSGAVSARSLSRPASVIINGTPGSSGYARASGTHRSSLMGTPSSGASRHGVGAPQSQELPVGDCLSAENSSFNMRYGVTVKTMAQRKHILDGQHFKELAEAHKNALQVSDFLSDVKILAANTKRPTFKGAKKDEWGGPSILT
ncbi:hypothetical protein PoB_004880700 [Plakobranchus ocellatus]|uniref:Uncharacterized protein n=1 Tax=Plakobranchus ocellatus TaxID=259542 RepID=A0AAV4BSJ5_9GAST|nr:hypothetical protein PoB_004880700 [Plakobranchus ocellatus]